MQKLLFLDRDGTIIHETEDEKIDTLDKLSFLPGVISNLSKIARELDFRLIMITNQDGLGTDFFPMQDFLPIHQLVLKILQGEGIEFAEVLIDEHFPEDSSPNRKPNTGLVEQYMNGGYDLANSFMVGDRWTDIQFAQNLGCQAIYIGEEQHPDAVLTTTDWREIYQLLVNK